MTHTPIFERVATLTASILLAVTSMSFAVDSHNNTNSESIYEDFLNSDLCHERLVALITLAREDQAKTEFDQCLKQIIGPALQEFTADVLGSAIRHGSPELLQYFIDGGLDVASSCINDHTPLLLAVITRDVDRCDIAARLLRAGDSATRICGRDDDGRILIESVRHNDFDLVHLLLTNGANPNASHLIGSTPIHQFINCLLAKDQPQIAIFKLLFEYGADPNAVNSQGETALFELMSSHTRNDLDDIITLFLKYGGLINRQSTDGDTALHNAARGYGYTNIVELLLRYGADPNIKNSEGYSVIDEVEREIAIFESETDSFSPDLISRKQLILSKLLETKQQ